ncbi:MAG: adenylate/guanylate cyclase domain-containing protein [Alphaproteobacteria bacterium]|nr:adenylate/guanylate cyclase domain-containing protein [Alphaproteobacteria bacterium]
MAADERRLTAIVSTDVVGYSRLMGADETGTLATLRAHRAELIDPKIAAHGGRIVKTMGDGLLLEFASVVEATQCAVEVQQGMAARNIDVPADEQQVLRIGVNLGDIIIDGEDIHGDGVNIAARLQELAEPGGICISSRVYDDVRDRLEIEFTDSGLEELKNIKRPVHVWRWSAMTGTAGRSQRQSEPPPPLPDKPSIVVLPFDNMSADPEQEYLADGIVETITAALSGIRSFFVIARNTAYTYKGKATNVLDIGRELGVAYVLEGSIQRAGGRVRITVQLVETEGGAHVWAERYDGEIDDIFDLQDRITEQVAGALQPSIRIAEIERSRRKRPQDLGAYDFAMRAMPHVWVLEKDESAIALELLDKSLEIDPDYPLALALAGWCHGQRSVYNWADDIAGSQAEALRLAERAAQLSGDDPLILTVLGTIHTFVRNHGTAQVLLKRAVALDPNSAWAWSRLGWLENYSDRPDRAIEHFEHALRLSPLDPMNFNQHVGMGSAYEVAQDYDRAIKSYSRGLEERPHAHWIERNLASCLSGAGRMEEARDVFARMMKSFPDLTVTKFKQAMVFSPASLDRMGENLKKLGLPD